MRSRKKAGNGGRDSLTVVMSPTRHDLSDLEHVKEILSRYPGKTKVMLSIKDTLGRSALLELGERYKVSPCIGLEKELSMYD